VFRHAWDAEGLAEKRRRRGVKRVEADGRREAGRGADGGARRGGRRPTSTKVSSGQVVARCRATSETEREEAGERDTTTVNVLLESTMRNLGY
jgi:hypothetical protein